MPTGRAPFDQHAFATCPVHGKVLFATRKIARRNASRLYPGEHFSAYPCDAQQGWHIGHLPAHIRAGENGREVINNTRTNRRTT